jgi:acetylornithine deacetylase/succinyl-diaminopimelate desuccinylase-like protein
VEASINKPAWGAISMGDSTAILDKIDGRRLGDDLWRLVQVPSPTGSERRAAMVFAEMLAAAGAEVVLDEGIPESPNVIGRLRGGQPGRTFQLAGHLDHIDVPHQSPERDVDNICGRGAADMKGGLALIIEAVRVLAESGSDFPGEVLITAWGLHEAPTGDSRGILNLIRRRVVGDAALVAESVHSQRDQAVIGGKGMGIWNLIIRWAGETSHELNRPPDSGGLFETALVAGQRLVEYGRQLEAAPVEGLNMTPESLFIGNMRYGDFYNRTATTCSLQGTRRWNPVRTSEQVVRELQDLVRATPCPQNVSAEIELRLVGEAYRVDPDELVVRALRSAWQEVNGSPIKLGLLSVITDANRLVRYGGVPSVLLESDNRCAHADREVVQIGNLVRACRVALLTTLNFLRGGLG